MRDILSDIELGQRTGEPNPMESAQRNMRTPLRKRFYKLATVAQDGGLFVLHLDGKPVRTPLRRPLAAPARAIADALASEWNAQAEVIDPASMPMTRIANAIIDAVADGPGLVADDIAKYLDSDLVCYRAEGPEALLALQAKHWDPVLAFARDALGARFVLAQGIVHAAQPEGAIAAARAAIPADPWRLGALSVVTTIAGSALIGLMLAAGRLTLEGARDAAHVDEDFQMSQWGRDETVMSRRAGRLEEFRAAELILRHGVP